MSTSLTDLATQVVELALRAGATAAEVTADANTHTEVEIRNGAIENLQQAGSRGLSIRLWVGDHLATTYTTDTSVDALQSLLRDTLALAPFTDAVPEQALPERAWLATTFADFDQWDESMAALTPDQRLALLRDAESAALGYDARITTSGGASWFDAAGERVLANSLGFVQSVRRTVAQLAVQVIADDADWKKRNGSWSTMACHLADLRDARSVGETAAARALTQLGSAPIATGRMPVVFDPQMAGALVGTLLGCMRGAAIERRSSYLLGRVGQAIASPLLTLVEDPTLQRRTGSRSFDNEGVASIPRTLIDQGVLQGYFLNCYSARKLGAVPTGHGSGEGISTAFVQPGTASPESLIADVKYGFYCESMMGFGFNATTGDFSRGASGRLIENGVLTRPVSEVTVSANFNDLFARIDGIANDLPTDRSLASPTFRVSEMTVAGS